MMSDLVSWSVRATNLPEHSENAIHTDAGAQAAGFPSALVAGTTVYAYLTHPPMALWGERWLSAGGGELRLRKPVFDKDLIDCVPVEGTLEARVDGDVRASFDLWETVERPLPRPGIELPGFDYQLRESNVEYVRRAGDDISLYAERGIIPPATWVELANRAFIKHFVNGPWVHTRSRIHHLGLATAGTTARVEATEVQRFESRAGERVMADIHISVNGDPVAWLEHEAIVAPND